MGLTTGSATALPVISHIWGEAPTLPIRTKICMVGGLPDVITCAKFQVEIFRGYDFTGGRISHFLLIFEWALQQCSATALPVISPICGKFRTAKFN